MIKRSTLSVMVIIATTILFQMCSTPQDLSVDADEHVKPTFENFDVTGETFAINSDEGRTIDLENGGSIVISPMAFVNANGDQITGEVQISLREFYTAADIIASGIPMKYEVDGKEESFVSAGMFEMKGTSNGEEVFIAPNSSIEYNMASNETDTDFDFYELNEQSGKWKNNGTAPVVANEKKAEIEAELLALSVPTEPILPAKADKGDQVISLDIDYTIYPEFREFHGLMWTAVDKNFDLKSIQKDWTSIDLEAKNTSILSFDVTYSNDEENYTVEMKPVLSETDYQKALDRFNGKLEAFQASLDRKSELEKMQKKHRDVIRTFRVRKFGIHNWDRIYKSPNTIIFEPDFVINEEHFHPEEMMIFVITPSDNAVVQYSGASLPNFSVDPNKVNKMMVVLPHDRVAVFKAKDFAAVSFTHLKNGKYQLI
ncbi:MAG: hypothetical protein HRT71_21840 [Flavobacteriales bacterium]|nr:hypothetical protein [Flavobacteriales bacterium]